MSNDANAYEDRSPVSIDVCGAKFAAASLLLSRPAGRLAIDGISLRPSPAGGVLIESTDGSVAFCVWDPEGVVPRACLVSPRDELISALNPRPVPNPDDRAVLDESGSPAPVFNSGLRLRGTVTGEDASPATAYLPESTPFHQAGPVAAGLWQLSPRKFPDLSSVLPLPSASKVKLPLFLGEVVVEQLGRVTRRLEPTLRGSSVLALRLSAIGPGDDGLRRCRVDIVHRHCGFFIAMTALPGSEEAPRSDWFAPNEAGLRRVCLTEGAS